MSISWISFVIPFKNSFQLLTDMHEPLQDAPVSHPFLAGRISPGIELFSSNTNSAIIGDAPVKIVLPFY